MLADRVRERLAAWLAKPGDRQERPARRLVCACSASGAARSSRTRSSTTTARGSGRVRSRAWTFCRGRPMAATSRSWSAATNSRCSRSSKRPFGPAYPVVVNIGCAEGYYAVGMAGRMPDTRVDAFDIDPAAQRACGELAARRGVADRVRVGARFTADDFAAYAARKNAGALRHRGRRAGAAGPGGRAGAARHGPDRRVARLRRRRNHQAADQPAFQSTHAITVVVDSGARRLRKVPPWFTRLGHLDQLLATWEWRSGPTPWLVMRSRQEPGQPEADGPAPGAAGPERT